MTFRYIFLVITSSNAESSEDWFKYGGFFKEKRKNGKRFAITGQTILSLSSCIQDFRGKIKMHAKKPKFL